jgi:hypothetical protein
MASFDVQAAIRGNTILEGGVELDKTQANMVAASTAFHDDVWSRWRLGGNVRMLYFILGWETVLALINSSGRIR